MKVQIMSDINCVDLHQGIGSVPVDCTQLLNLGIVYYESNDDDRWVEYKPFTGRIRKFPAAELTITEILVSAQGVVDAIVASQNTPEDPYETIKADRAAAYTAESDPLFFKAQRGEGSLEDWLAKVEEIRARYPKKQVND